MKNITNVENLKNKKVLLRVDFNVSVENGKIKDKFKIEALQKTVSFLLENGAKVALLTHLGRPKDQVNPEFSLSQIKDEIVQILDCQIIFVSDCLLETRMESLENLEKNQVILLENVRFYAQEKENDENFAQKLTQGFDVFVNDAFGVSHRDQASLTGVTKFLPSYAGFNLQKEITELSQIRENFSSPSVAVIGGAKIETKLPVIKFFEEIYDTVLVGGKVANEALDSGENFGQKIFLPTDFVGDRLDIGEKTQEVFKQKISEAKTIVWNGPMGKFEEEKYSHGTSEIYKAILENKEAIKVTGGGETLEILEKNNSFSEFSFVSTGGGAMLEFIVKGTLPGIEALK